MTRPGTAPAGAKKEKEPIPPDAFDYLRTHRLDRLFEQLARAVTAERPDDPASFLSTLLSSGSFAAVPPPRPTPRVVRRRTDLPWYKLVLFDADGTLYNWEEPVDGAQAAVSTLQREGVAVGVLTNSTRRRKYVQDKLKRLHFYVDNDSVLTSASLAAMALKQAGLEGKWVFVLGPESLCEELAESNIRGSTTVPKDCGESAELPAAVLVGQLGGSLDVSALSFASLALRRGVGYYSCTRDPDVIFRRTQLIPGNSLILDALTRQAGRPPTIIGKPSGEGIRHMMECAGVKDPSKVLYVGDQAETDVAAANAAGVHSMLVFSGCATEEDAQKLQGNLVPTYLARSLDVFNPPGFVPESIQAAADDVSRKAAAVSGTASQL